MQEANPSQLASKINRIGLLIGVAVPLAALGIALLLSDTWPVTAQPPSRLMVSLLVLGVLPSPIIGFFIFKRGVLKPEKIAQMAARTKTPASKNIYAFYVTVFNMAAAPSPIGLIILFLGGGLRWPGILAGVSLLAYVWLRPKDGEIEDLLSEVNRLQQSSGNLSA